jgi:hypothetical protein
MFAFLSIDVKNTCVFTRFHCVKNANTQLIWSSASVAVKSRTSTPENSNNGAFLDSDIIFFPRGIEVSDAEALVTMSMIISESKNAPLLLFSGVDVRDFTATLVLTG